MIPSVVGQIIGFLTERKFDFSLFLSGICFGLLCLLSIIFLNDLADEKVDQLKRSLLPHDSSPKTLPDKLIPKKLVIFLAITSTLSFITLGFLLEFLVSRTYLGFFSIIIFLLNYSYSFSPLKLNYRFGGEFVEAFGVGCFLPYFNAYLQSAVIWHPHYYFFIGFFFWALSQALCSGICDVNSDKLGGKKTFSSIYSNRKTIFLIFISLTLCTFLWTLSEVADRLNTLGLKVFLFTVLLFSARSFLYYANDSEIEINIGTQKRFRNFLHKLTFVFIVSILVNLSLIH